jgi:AcrR family transcriptional regulator
LRERALRADARRNHGLIVATAARLLTTNGPGVSMEEIAQAAGLGVGTLYRHFPDRNALLDDIAADSLQQLLAAARALAAGPQSRWDVLLLIIERCTGLPLALTKALAAGTPRPSAIQELVRSVDAVLEEIAGQAQREGSVRSDLPATEIVELISVAVCRPAARADDALTTVILDGLRARPPAGEADQPGS